MPSDFLATLGGFIVYALALAVIPFLPLLIGSRVINTIEDARSPWTPFIELLALLVGGVAGALVLAHNLPPGALAAGAIFREGGPWDLSPGQFLGRWANPFAYDYGALVPWPFARAGTGVCAIRTGCGGCGRWPAAGRTGSRRLLQGAEGSAAVADAAGGRRRAAADLAFEQRQRRRAQSPEIL